MKSKLLAICLAVAALAVSVGATLAYLTDEDAAENVFTVGDVRIALLESRYPRVNAATDQPADGADNTSADSYARAHGWDGAYCGDAVIAADAAEYAAWLKQAGDRILPGQAVEKRIYVRNTGGNAAYVRVRVRIGKDFAAHLDDSRYPEAPMEAGEIVLTEDEVTVAGTDYVQYTFTYQKPLSPGEITFWNCWDYVRIAPGATAGELSQYVENGTFTVPVEADAIQATGFADAAAAFAAFDARQ